MTAPFKDQHRGGHQEPDQLPAPEYRPDQPDAEDHARGRPEYGDDSERMSKRVVHVAAGQGAADDHVDRVDD